MICNYCNNKNIHFYFCTKHKTWYIWHTSVQSYVYILFLINLWYNIYVRYINFIFIKYTVIFAQNLNIYVTHLHIICIHLFLIHFWHNIHIYKFYFDKSYGTKHIVHGRMMQVLTSELHLCWCVEVAMEVQRKHSSLPASPVYALKIYVRIQKCNKFNASNRIRSGVLSPLMQSCSHINSDEVIWILM